MQRPSHITLIAIPLVGLLIGLVLLPGIAGVIEGDFEYLRWEFDQGWNHKNDTSLPKTLSNIYAWSFWRIGLNGKEPRAYQWFLLDRDAENLVNFH